MLKKMKPSGNKKEFKIHKRQYSNYMAENWAFGAVHLVKI